MLRDVLHELNMPSGGAAPPRRRTSNPWNPC